MSKFPFTMFPANDLGLPGEFGTLPPNFRHAAYLPGQAMAKRADLIIHHGGHSSVMTGLAAGTPAVIIPTITERESNARRVVALGAGEIAMPTDTADGEKHVYVKDFRAKVERVMNEPSYRQRAEAVAASMRHYGGAQEAAGRVEQFAASKS
jgi:UDP:flavonoid glycosyltransferase YjiC (YdhE family)